MIQTKKICYLNDKVAKKGLTCETKETFLYASRIIAHTTGIPIEEVSKNLKLIHTDIASNLNVVKSISDVPFENNSYYFALEVNYSKSRVYLTKNIIYTYQLVLDQVPNSKKYKDIKRVNLININAEDIYKENKFVYETVLMENNIHKVYPVNFVNIFDINLSYFKNIRYNEIKKNSLEKDLALFIIDKEEDFNKLYEDDEGAPVRCLIYSW